MAAVLRVAPLPAAAEEEDRQVVVLVMDLQVVLRFLEQIPAAGAAEA
jgi:hypothetical protein